MKKFLCLVLTVAIFLSLASFGVNAQKVVAEEGFLLSKIYKDGKLIEEYDKNGNLIYENYGNSWYRYTYDDSGKILKRTANWGYDEYTYDEQGRVLLLESEKYNEVLDKVFKQTIKYTYEADGVSYSATVYEGQYTREIYFKREYDEYGRVIVEKEQDIIGPDRYEVKYTYDSEGNLLYADWHVSQGFVGRKTYNKKGTIIQVEGHIFDSGDIYVLYNDSGNLLYESRTLLGSKDRETIYTYDERGKLLEVNTKYTENEIYPLHSNEPDWEKKVYTYDLSGNLYTVEKTESNGRWDRVTYNIKGEEMNFDSNYGDWRKTTFDAEGNIYMKEKGFADGKWDRTIYNIKGEKVSVDTNYGDFELYFYDEFGNLIRKKTNREDITYEYIKIAQ